MSSIINLKVTGMMCQKNCGKTVENALKTISNLTFIEVSFENSLAKIKGNNLNLNEIIQVIEDVGFEACLYEHTKPNYTFKVLGMMCQKNCGSTVENALKSISGVITAKVDFPTQKAEVWVENNKINDINIFKNAIEDVGFDVVFDNNTNINNNINNNNNNNNNTINSSISSISNDSHDSNNDILPDSVYWSEKKFNPVIDIPKIRETLLIVEGILSVEFDEQYHLIKVWGFADTIYVQKVLKDCGFPTQVFQSINDAIKSQKERKNRFHLPQTPTIDVSSYKNNDNAYVANLLVGGMSCANCAKSIESNLLKKSGILSVRVALLSGRVEVIYDESIFGKYDQISNIIISLGYSAKFEGNPQKYGTISKNRTKKLQVKITGMSCSSSAKDIESAICLLKGVLEAKVSIKTNIGNFVLEDSSINGGIGPRKIIEEIEKMGYWCKHIPSHEQVNSDDNNSETADIQEWWKLLVISLILGLPVMLLHISMILSEDLMMMFEQPGICNGSISKGQTIMALLNTPLQIIVGYRFYRGAFLSAMHGSFGMDCLVVTGTTITFLYSAIQFLIACQTGFTSVHMFFETSGMLLMFVTLGKYIEAYAKGATASAMTSLLKLQPRKAFLVMNANGSNNNNNSDYSDNNNNNIKNLNSTYSPLSETMTTKSTSSTLSTSPSLPLSPNSPTLFNNTLDITDDDWIEQEVKEIDIELIDRNDVIKVFPGERFPTDGEVVRGSSYVDESLITGESVPVLRGVGSTVYGSTINQKGLIYIRVTSLGDETALSQIVKLIEMAQMNKAPIQAYADLVAGVFTPTVLCLSLITYLIWYLLAFYHVVPNSWLTEAGYGNEPLLFALLFAISVVVISCPCALGLATPTAIMVGTSVGALNGVLIKGGPPFEVAHRVNTLIFDKTGTLTVGKPILTDELIVADPSQLKQLGATPTEQKDYMLRLAALAEQGSEHPLASAVVNAAKSRNLTLPDSSRADFSIHTGGVKCSFPDGTCILVGNRSHMEVNNIVLGPLIDSSMWDLEIQGKTAVCVAFNSMIIGVLGIADIIKPEAHSTIKSLKSMGIDLWMVTGDNRTTASAIGDELEIPQDRIIAGALPSDKVQKVIALQESGKCVAMIGDGINDSPAISQADLGIAIGAGTHIAIDAADMVIVRSNLHDVVAALDLAKLVFSRIKWNLMWALLYNVLAIPIAAGACFPITHTILPPQYAGLCMALSSISVVVSSMMLKLYKRPSIINSNPEAQSSNKSIISRARGRLVKLKDELSRRVEEITGNGSYSSVTTADDDDGDEENVYEIELGRV